MREDCPGAVKYPWPPKRTSPGLVIGGYRWNPPPPPLLPHLDSRRDRPGLNNSSARIMDRTGAPARTRPPEPRRSRHCPSGDRERGTPGSELCPGAGLAARRLSRLSRSARSRFSSLPGRRRLRFESSLRRNEKKLARLRGLEPRARCLEGSCSIHLSYRRARR